MLEMVLFLIKPFPNDKTAQTAQEQMHKKVFEENMVYVGLNVQTYTQEETAVD